MLFVPRTVCNTRKHFFRVGVIEPWNNLNGTKTDFSTLGRFKSLLRRMDLRPYLRYSCCWFTFQFTWLCCIFSPGFHPGFTVPTLLLILLCVCCLLLTRCYMYVSVGWTPPFSYLLHVTLMPLFVCFYTVSQKRHQTLSLSLSNINRFSTFFHCYTRQEICNKAVITDPITPQRCRCEILGSRNCSDWKHTSSTPSAHALLRNVALFEELLLSNYDETKTYRSARQIAQPVVLKCPKRRLLKNWLKQTATRDLSAPNSCWMMLSSFGSVIKSYSH